MDREGQEDTNCLPMVDGDVWGRQAPTPEQDHLVMESPLPHWLVEAVEHQKGHPTGRCMQRSAPWSTRDLVVQVE